MDWNLAWASGVQRDMGESRSVYLCEIGKHGRPATAGTFDAMDPAESATVSQQDAFQPAWIADRRNGSGA